MMPGYNRYWWNWGAQALIAPPEIPNPNLNIGAAEELRGLPIILRYDPNFQSAVVAPPLTTRDIGPKLNDMQMFAGQFPNTGWIGNPLEVY